MSHFIIVEYRPFYVMAGIWRQNAKKNNAVAFPYGRRQQPQTALTPSPRIAKGCNSAAPRSLQPRRNVRSGATTAAPRVKNNNIAKMHCFEVGLVSRPTASVAVARVVTGRLKMSSTADTDLLIAQSTLPLSALVSWVVAHKQEHQSSQSRWAAYRTDQRFQLFLLNGICYFEVCLS